MIAVISVISVILCSGGRWGRPLIARSNAPPFPFRFFSRHRYRGQTDIFFKKFEAKVCLLSFYFFVFVVCAAS